MATTYDKASLVMIPSGYKDDKLYSIKPTDGSGDFTFSRDGAGASPATRVNASGLIEKGRTNELTYSNDFGNAAWIKSSASVTGGQTGYDGSSDAWLLSSTGGYAFISVTTSGVQTYSVYAKQGTLEGIRLRIDAGTDANAYINLNDGSEYFPHTGIDLNVTSVGGGWWRVSLTADESIGNVRIYALDNLGSSSTGTIYIQDAQLEQGLIATSVIETTTSPVSAGLLGDMPRLDYSGGATCGSLLLEPSRVNSVTQSEYLDSWGATNVAVTSNDTTSPEGVVNASKLERNAAGGYISLNTSATGDQSYSIFAKAGDLNYVRILALGTGNPNVYFDLSTGSVGTETAATGSIEDYGNGWYRCTIIYNTTITAVRIYPTETDASTGGATGYVYAWGAQAELGSYPTSYIPTYGSASTRGDDVCSKTGISSLIGQSEGTLFWEVDFGENYSSTFPAIFLWDGTSTNRMLIQRRGNNDKLQFQVIVGGATQVDAFGVTSVGAGKVKIAIAYKQNDFVLYLNGTQEASDTSGITYSGALSQVLFNTNERRDRTSQLLLFKTRLTNAELAALTTI